MAKPTLMAVFFKRFAPRLLFISSGQDLQSVEKVVLGGIELHRAVRLEDVHLQTDSQCLPSHLVVKQAFFCGFKG